jgi:hypothetical protein
MRELLARWQVAIGIVFFSCILASPRVLALQNANNPIDPMQSVIDQIVRSTDVEEVQKSYKLLFRDAKADLIRALKNHANDGLALRAAWEDVRLTVPVEEPKHAVRPGARQLQRFLGVVEGRLKITLPSWWEAVVRDCQANHRSNIYFEERKEFVWDNINVGLRAPAGTSLVKSDDKVVIKVGNQSCSVPFRIIDASRKRGHNCISALITDDKCFLETHYLCCAQYKVLCLDRKDGTLVWEAPVWSNPRGHGYSGISYHWVQLVRDRNNLFVFGVGPNELYVEGFDTGSGKNLFRFNTDF